MVKDWQARKDTAFIVVDMTNDFCPPGGALKVEGGTEIIPVINALRTHFQTVILTKEEHDAGHAFFASTHTGKKPLDTVQTNFGVQYLWPDHCVKGTQGAEFHDDLIVKPEDVIVIKGTDPTIHAYSAFYMDDRKTIIHYEDGKTLTEKLKDLGIKKLVVTGLASDFCAGMTAYDAAKEGFDVVFVEDASRSINISVGNGRTTVDIMNDMFKEAGVKIVKSADVALALGVADLEKKPVPPRNPFP